MPECSRPRCPLPARTVGLCQKHYNASPLKGYVDATPVLRHIDLLHSKGHTLESIAELANIDRSTIQGLGKWTAAAGVQKRIAAAIFAIDVPDKFIPSLRSVPAIGTQRRLQALVMLGWSQYVLAEKCGVSQAALWEWMNRDGITAATAATVQAVYDELEMTSGPSKRAADIARRRGWHPPFAWDEDTIDDPDAAPDLDLPKLSVTEWHTELARDGWSDDEIAAELNIHTTSLHRALQRAS